MPSIRHSLLTSAEPFKLECPTMLCAVLPCQSVEVSILLDIFKTEYPGNIDYNNLFIHTWVQAKT